MNLLRKLILILVILVVVAVIVVATLPARFAYRYVSAYLGAVHLDGISGNVWNGHADALQVFGQNLGAIDWHLDVAPLLGRVVRAHLVLGGGELNATGIVERAADASINLRDATLQMPASMLAPALDIPALNLLGEIDSTIVHARLQGIWLNQANGSVIWKNAGVAGAAQAQFGDLQATFTSTSEDTIAGTVRDLGGPLQVHGNFKIASGQFDADATLAARDGNPQVIDALRYIGQPQADGSSHLIIHGQLFKIF